MLAVTPRSCLRDVLELTGDADVAVRHAAQKLLRRSPPLPVVQPAVKPAVKPAVQPAVQNRVRGTRYKVPLPEVSE